MNPNSKAQLDAVRSNAPTITVLYSCHQCGIHKAEVTTVARTTEDVVPWMEALAITLSRDHDRRSPHCRITSISEVYLPMPAGVDRVGGAPRQ